MTSSLSLNGHVLLPIAGFMPFLRHSRYSSLTLWSLSELSSTCFLSSVKYCRTVGASLMSDLIVKLDSMLFWITGPVIAWSLSAFCLGTKKLAKASAAFFFLSSCSCFSSSRASCLFRLSSSRASFSFFRCSSFSSRSFFFCSSFSSFSFFFCSSFSSLSSREN